MIWKTSAVILLLALCVQLITAQENANRVIAPGLRECYADPYLSVRDNLLPHTMDTLINIIRKIENYPGNNLGITQLSVSLLHRFRQDGIVRSESNSNAVIPYMASEFQWGKHQLLLKKLIPSNGYTFLNETLSAVERCTLHSMLSSTIDTRRRGDEGQRCSQLANYRAMRIPRSLKESKSNLNQNLAVDVDFVSKSQGKVKKETFGKLQAAPPRNNENDEYDYDNDDEQKEHVDTIFISSVNNVQQRSECPVEHGVVYTPWGTVAAGNIINGIASGLQIQKVAAHTLMGGRKRANQQNPMIDNRWASTLAGDLAEVALRQGARDISNINIGAPGAWNSSVAPKWYFISQREKYEMTDAEIRGDIDGLIMALKIKEWERQAGTLKLSQVLDMYYSQSGMFYSGIRACDRKKYFSEMIKPEELKQQTTAFSKILQGFISEVTIQDDGFAQFATAATDALLRYIPNSLNDRSCESTAPNPNEVETDVSTDLIVFIDTTWPFKEIYGYISYILSKINLDGASSTVTLLDAMDAKYISNRTWDAATALQNWTETDHQARRSGLSLPNVFLQLENITKEIMHSEKVNKTVGGGSLVALIVPYTAAVNDGDSNFAWERVKIIREEAPDTRILFFAQGSVNRFERFVANKEKDLIPAQTSSDQIAVVEPVVSRMKQLSRRIINNQCGHDWENSGSTSTVMKQCLSAGSTKYYRLMPNYFFRENGNRKLTIKAEKGTFSVTVCVSREMENPRANATVKPDDLDCKPIITNSHELKLENPCYGNYEIHNCKPYYVSVEAGEYSGNSMIADKDCKLPTDIPITITAEHLTCDSGAERIYQTSLLILVSYIMVLWCRN